MECSQYLVEFAEVVVVLYFPCYCTLRALLLYPIWTKYFVLKHVWDQNDSENVIFISLFLPTIFSLISLIQKLKIEWIRSERASEGESRQCTAQYGIPIALEFICYSENETQLNRKTCSQMGIHNCFVVWITYIRILISPFTIDSWKSLEEKLE